MELLDGAADIVHPEVRAHIGSLVSALGGISTEDDGNYQLGDDAVEVLRDLKRWIRFYDEKTNRMDVARCIFDANLVEGDLLPILKTWPENAMCSKFRSRVALACFELIVPLTWPIEWDKERMTVNHHRHLPVLELAQVQYKRAIINFDGARILRAAVRTALPAMALPIGDRTARDEGIIKLVLFFLRNMASITPPPNGKYEGDESQVSRSATIDAFAYQDIFHVLLMLSSNMGEDFRTEDTTVMEIIYHLVKRVDPEKLFMSEQQLNKAKAAELSALMNKESAMLQSHNRKGATRHSRFGTMIWVKRDDGKMTSLSGQDALANSSIRNQIMDEIKTFKPPRRARKDNQDERDLGPPAKLNARANNQLRKFVDEFLDSGFNPLFQHIRKTIDREAPHVLQYHRRQFFYLVAWFLEAERTRRKAKGPNCEASADISSFQLVAGVLNQEMFITLNRALHESYDVKDWTELTAVMRCFTQILLTVQEMTESANEDDQEIAENVLSRLFYEEATHDAIANIIRMYKDQGFDYLDASTELVHHFLRILEAYSKQNVDMQVRSRKRTRRKKKQAAKEDSKGEEAELDDSADDEETAERTSKERKFDFHKFSSRFTPQGVVDTFTRFTRYYRDLTDAQLKRAHRYFYRVAFKQDMSVMLFRVDIIHLLYNMIKGPNALERTCSMFKDWEELVKQILRKCTKKIQERPELLVEMLFSKLSSTAFFLEYGYERQVTSRSQPKPAAELEFKHTEERDQQVAIAVGALLDKNGSEHINWVRRVLSDAESERRAWSAAADAKHDAEAVLGDEEPETPPVFTVKPDNPERRTAMFKNAHLRLLMKLCGMQLMGPASEETPESLWIIPGAVSANQLKDTIHFINQAELSPPTFEDGVLAEHQLKRKAAAKRKAAFDDEDADDDDDDGFLDDEMLFPAGGPTARKVADEKRKPKKARRRRKAADTEELTDSVAEEKARRRREKELEKARKIKSALYVRDGDDEFDSDEDEAFFAREREIAARAKKAAETAAEPISLLKKRKSTVASDASDDDDDDDDDEDESILARRVLSSQEDRQSETDDTPVDLSDGEARKRRKVSVDVQAGGDDGDDEDLDDDIGTKTTGMQDGDGKENAQVGVTRRPRVRVRGGFIMDSDDDE
ncbi:drug resistance protein MdrA [Metarhizium album ARSEF 1941]|uniref:Topoisomerase 1-associated factor 1 n=1 Tax=Metarhizium album (strain ARSEF 1941) TaxID=1081103 RepID=A0A0B2X567_METAS|nr:drug resistance protein MdrA [Metarhizium album ARSEF 1941]KHO01519.1 drug resistance protein MdrA [Metarhizium album ARSEF 1941]